MRKSKYLILSEFYFYFNDDLTEITNVKELFENQNILDLFRFKKMKFIKKNQFLKCKNINFVYLPININKIYEQAFHTNQIEILDLSKCLKLKWIDRGCFENNQIKRLKLPENIEIIDEFAFYRNQIKILDLSNCINLKSIDYKAFFKNQIKILDLSNCIKLKNIELGAFEENQIKQLKLPENIEIINSFSFYENQIEILDLSKYMFLYEIFYYAFSNNPLKEIKILDNVEIKYGENNKDDFWNKFVKYYNRKGKQKGDYKLENNQWQWYPL